MLEILNAYTASWKEDIKVYFMVRKFEKNLRAMQARKRARLSH